MLILTGNAAALAFSPPGTPWSKAESVCACVCVWQKVLESGGGGEDVGAALIIS